MADSPPTGTAVSRRQAPPDVVVTLVLGLSALLLATLVPLPPTGLDDVVSSYGVHDNRRLLLVFAALVVTALAGALSRCLPGLRRGPPSPPGPPSTEAPPPGEPLTVPGAPAHPAPRPLNRRLLLCLLLASGCLLLGPGIAYRALNGHEAVHLGYLSQIGFGQLLCVDTMTIYGPLLGYTEYAFMKLTTFSILGFRLYWTLVNVVTLALLLALAARWIRHRGLVAALALWLLLETSLRAYLPDARGIQGGFWGWGSILRHGWIALTVLGSAAWLARSASPLPRALLGAALAAGIQYSPETMVPGGAALLILGLGCHPPGRARPGAYCAAALVGALGTTVLLLLPVLLRGALGAYLENVQRIPRLYLRGLGNRPYPGPFQVDRGGLAALTYYLVPAALLVALWVSGRRLGSGAPRPVVLFSLALAGTLSWTSVLVRGDLEHLLNATAVPIVLLFLWLDEGWPALTRPLPRVGRALAPALIVLPLCCGTPGPLELAHGAAGRVRHFWPGPPAGYYRIPLEQARIWVPSDTTWFDAETWGRDPGVQAMALIHALSRGRRVHIMGMRGSTCYFLARALSAGPYTDLSAECLTRAAYTDLWEGLRANPPDYVFTEAADQARGPRESDGFRRLGVRAGYLVSQHIRLEPVRLDTITCPP